VVVADEAAALAEELSRDMPPSLRAPRPSPCADAVDDVRSDEDVTVRGTGGAAAGVFAIAGVLDREMAGVGGLDDGVEPGRDVAGLSQDVKKSSSSGLESGVAVASMPSRTIPAGNLIATSIGQANDLNELQLT
jgi:hypothetical protein